MEQIPLPEFAARHGQTKAAAMLGLTQGAISKAIRVGRNVVVTCKEDGTCSAQELRPFPASKSAA